MYVHVYVVHVYVYVCVCVYVYVYVHTYVCVYVYVFSFYVHTYACTHVNQRQPCVSIYDSNKVMAPLLFYLLQVVMFFILLKIFLAIICDAYADVKGNQSEEDLNFYSNLKDQLLDKISSLVKRKRDIKDLTEDILASDRNVDGLIDEDELKEVLKDNPKAYEILNSRGAKDLLAKYDVNQDGVLDKAEMSVILRELAEKEA